MCSRSQPYPEPRTCAAVCDDAWSTVSKHEPILLYDVICRICLCALSCRWFGCSVQVAVKIVKREGLPEDDERALKDEVYSGVYLGILNARTITISSRSRILPARINSLVLYRDSIKTSACEKRRLYGEKGRTACALRALHTTKQGAHGNVDMFCYIALSGASSDRCWITLAVGSALGARDGMVLDVVLSSYMMCAYILFWIAAAVLACVDCCSDEDHAGA